MKPQQQQFIREVIDHFVDMYKFDLNPYYRAYQFYFEKGPAFRREILIDFLRRVKMPAQIRLEKVPIINDSSPDARGVILGIQKPFPLLWNSDAFRETRFIIQLHEEVFSMFDYFISVLVHELGHLVLYSTYNKYRDSEVAVDLFVMTFGLYEQMLALVMRSQDSPGRDGYITKEEVVYAHEYILQKRIELAR